MFVDTLQVHISCIIFQLLADHFHLRILAGALTLINLKRAAEFNILLKGTSEMVPLTAA